YERARINLRRSDVSNVVDTKRQRATAMLVAHLHHQLVVSAENRSAFRFESFNEFCFGCRNILDGSEVLKVYRSDHQFHCNVWRCDLAEPPNLMCRRRHAHLQHREIELIRRTVFTDHPQDRQRQSQTVVVIPLAFQNTPTCPAENVRGQLFRSRFARAASNRNYWFSPRGVNAMREQL